MKKKMLSKALAASIITSVLMTNSVLASGAELPENFNLNADIEIQLTLNDVVRSYSSYKGKSVVVDEIRTNSSGYKYYYRGTVEYIGRDGWFGNYQYLGDLSTFTLIKIVSPGGVIITPTSINNNVY